MNRLTELKARRDELNTEIKLIEEGIRKAAEHGSYISQLLAINEERQQQGKPVLTMSQFLAGEATSIAGEQSS